MKTYFTFIFLTSVLFNLTANAGENDAKLNCHKRLQLEIQGSKKTCLEDYILEKESFEGKNIIDLARTAQCFSIAIPTDTQCNGLGFSKILEPFCGEPISTEKQQNDALAACRKSGCKCQIVISKYKIINEDLLLARKNKNFSIHNPSESTTLSDSTKTINEKGEKSVGRKNIQPETIIKHNNATSQKTDLFTNELEQALAEAEKATVEKEELRLRADSLAKEKEQAQAKAEALAKETEKIRAEVKKLETEKEKELARAQSFAKDSEDAKRQAELRTKMAEEAAAKEVRVKELALIEANKKIAELTEQAKLTSKTQRGNENSSKRKALLIGNDKYQAVTPLNNAGADAHSMGRALATFGYKVWVKTDLNRRNMHAAIRQFKAEVEGGDEVVVFYAGHAVQIGSANYLLPIDIVGSSEDEVKDDAIQLQRLLEDMGERKTQITLAMVDACRDNPFKKSGRNIGGRGLAPTAAATGQMIIFSAGVGQQALDRLGNDDQDPNGLFTRIFIKEMKVPGQRIDNLAREVRKKVVEAAKAVGHEQVPAIYDQVVGDFYFSQ